MIGIYKILTKKSEILWTVDNSNTKNNDSKYNSNNYINTNNGKSAIFKSVFCKVDVVNDDNDNDEYGGFDNYLEFENKLRETNLPKYSKKLKNIRKTTSHRVKPTTEKQQPTQRHKSTVKVAIGSALTSINISFLTEQDDFLKEMPMFSEFLPTFCKTASVNVSESIVKKLRKEYSSNKSGCKNNDDNTNIHQLAPLTYEYHFYIAYDYTDEILNDFIKSGAFYGAFNETASMHCPTTLKLGLHFVRCDHTKHPAWAQNDAMIEAYLDGAEYFYRVNDDTLMLTENWTNAFVDVFVNKFEPPNVGVVGPFNIESNELLLTYDFVHRTHAEIFGFHYPRLFTDWWADDWITKIYKPNRSVKVNEMHLKHSFRLGRRYLVLDYKVKRKLAVQLNIDKKTLKRYLSLTRANMEGRKDKQLQNMNDKTKQKVISMSLYGSDPRITWGAIRNTHLSKLFFPGWKIRFYVSKSTQIPNNDTFIPKASLWCQTFSYSESNQIEISRKLICQLKQLGAEIRYVPQNATIDPTNWRNLVIFDQTVEWFLIRDSGSRLTETEAEAVEEWISSLLSSPSFSSSQLSSLSSVISWVKTIIFSSTSNNSNKPSTPPHVLPFLHAIRDHPSHAKSILPASTWGGNALLLRDVFSRTVSDLTNIFSARDDVLALEGFLDAVKFLVEPGLPSVLNAVSRNINSSRSSPNGSGNTTDTHTLDVSKSKNVQKTEKNRNAHINANVFSNSETINDDIYTLSNTATTTAITKLQQQNKHSQEIVNHFPNDLKKKLKLFLKPKHIDFISCRKSADKSHFVGQLFDEHELPYLNNVVNANNNNINNHNNTNNIHNINNNKNSDRDLIGNKFENFLSVSPSRFCSNIISNSER